MKNYAFNKQVGQVAGRDIKAHSARIFVNLNFYHHKFKRIYFSKRQRALIVRKVDYIASVIGVDRAIVCRRLTSLFAINGINQLPHDQFKHAMAYLDNCLVHDIEQIPSDTYLHCDCKKEMCRFKQFEFDKCSDSGVSFSTGRGNFGLKYTKRITVMMAMIGLWMVVELAEMLFTKPSTLSLPQCEYGGHRYSIGSVVMQAGTCKECVQAGKHVVAWQQISL